MLRKFFSPHMMRTLFGKGHEITKQEEGVQGTPLGQKIFKKKKNFIGMVILSQYVLKQLCKKWTLGYNPRVAQNSRLQSVTVCAQNPLK